jgi:hypothetical protein
MPGLIGHSVPGHRFEVSTPSTAHPRFRREESA